MLSLSELQAQASPPGLWFLSYAFGFQPKLLRLSRDRAPDISRDERLDWTWKQRPWPVPAYTTSAFILLTRQAIRPWKAIKRAKSGPSGGIMHWMEY